MTAEDFRRVALSFEGVEEGSHMGSPDFRVGGRIFATLAAHEQGYGNLLLTPEQQADFVSELPEVFLPIAGGWEEWEQLTFVLPQSTRTSSPARCEPPGTCAERRTSKPSGNPPAKPNRVES